MLKVVHMRTLLTYGVVIVFFAMAGYTLLGYFHSLDVDPADELEPTLAPPGIFTPGQQGSQTEPVRDFFAQHRLEREKQRSIQVELLRQIINNANTSDEVRQQAQRDWLSLTALMEKELMVEKLVVSKGYADAILVYNNDVAHMIVKVENMTQAQAIQITEVVASALKLTYEKVRVIERSK